MLATVTGSMSVLVDLEEARRLGGFWYEVVMVEEETRHIMLYEHQEENGWLMLLPLGLLEEKRNRVGEFCRLLMVCGQSITIPIDEELLREMERMIGEFGLKYQVRRGSHVYKLYIGGECMINYLDLITFQAVQCSGKTMGELLAMKKVSAYEYSLSLFKEKCRNEVLGTNE